MNKLKLFTLFAAMLFATSMWAADPTGCVDAFSGHNGSIYIKGWAADPDNTSATLAIHVYMYKQGVADPVLGEGNTVANIDRADLAQTGYGTKHGFERYISTEGLAPGNYWINIYAINASGTGGTNVRLHHYTQEDYFDFHVTISSQLTISYNANGGSGAPSSQQKRYGININLQSKGSLARTGYTADGWATSAGGNKAYNFGASYSGNSSTTLYAHWTANTYKVKFNGNGSTGGSMSDQNFTYGTAQNLTANAFSKTGYTFAGWATSSTGAKAYNDKQSVNNLTATNGGTVNLYAVWTANKYTVTFDRQDGTGGSSSVQATYDANMPSATMPTRTGYIFQGYYDATSGGTLYYNADGSSARTWNKTAAATLYARWEIINYTIAYNLDGGEATNPTEYTVETETFTLNNPTKEGYVFTGWTGSNGEEPQTEVTIAKGSTENKSYTANWTALKPCELGWMNVPEGGVVGTIGHEDEIVLPQVNASQDFILAYQAQTVTLRLGSTDESVLKVFGFNNFQVIGVGECDVYVVHDEDAVFAYDSAAFHVTVNPEPTPAPTVWTSLKVGDVIKVGDKIEVPAEGDGSWGINGNVLRNTWGPYELIRANIVQENDWDDPVVTEAEDGAYYVFKAENSDFYPLSNLAKGGLPVTETSDGLEVTEAENKDFTVAVHEGAPEPGPATAIDNTAVDTKAVKRIANGQLLIIRDGKTYNAQGAQVR